MRQATGYLALVLHAHLPYVRHPESEHYFEERWLYEAITESYIPLLQVYKGLIRDGVHFRLTMSITPTLVSLLTDELLQDRYLRHIEKLIELSRQEMERTKEMPELRRLAVMYHEKFISTRDFYWECDGALIRQFREIQEQGFLEIITSAATHAFLPLIKTEEALRAQIQTAVDFHARHFGRRPRGIWLPECGFFPGVDKILREAGLEFFFVDTHGLQNAQPAPAFGMLSPILTPHGVAAFARDENSARQVWSSKVGYPGDFDYREYYRDIGQDLDMDIVGPFMHPDGIRWNTGMKYYRVTGSVGEKQPYDPAAAKDKAARHAEHFKHHVMEQMHHGALAMGRQPIATAPFDAELFGHWWYEGPTWIDCLLRQIHSEKDTLATITPSEYLSMYPDYQVCELSMSSWGRDGYGDVWLRKENDWIYPALHWMEERLREMADSFVAPDPLIKRALDQAARELLLAQSSDWAFIMDKKTMVDYAIRRFKVHVNRFRRLYEMVMESRIDPLWLSDLEKLDPIFPDLDYRVYQTAPPVAEAYATSGDRETRSRILMLSWEFPPMTVGGLSRHVYDLSRHLARLGCEIHVVTTEIGDYPQDEVVEGVHVHRVRVLRPDGGEFIHFAFGLNLAMITRCQQLLCHHSDFALIHAHDWLVCYAADALKQQYGLPLVATIHATEHGRNQGIRTDLQHYIHSLEWKLTYEAERVILCSTYMRREVESLFQLPAYKLHVIPNGVDRQMLQTRKNSPAGHRSHDPTILYVGRLVREKGVQTLIEAAPKILSEHPRARIVIVGKGPAQGELEQQAARLGVMDRVEFKGFVADEERNRLLQSAAVAVFPSLYEPFGIVALEAMAAGTPVVASDVGGLADVVAHEHNGLKMLPGDAYSLALQVGNILRDPAFALTLAATAQAELGLYDWDHIAKDTLRVYRLVAPGILQNEQKRA